MERQGYHYSAKTLKMANNRVAADQKKALKGVMDYFSEEFAGLDIPNDCIQKAFSVCVKRANTQAELNTECKNYLLKNLRNM